MANYKNKIPDNATVITQISKDRYYLYIKSRPDGMVDPERSGLPALVDYDGSLISLPKNEQIDKLRKGFWNSYQKELNDHFRIMNHQILDDIGTHAKLILPEGAFDEQIVIAEMFTIGRATSFKIELSDGHIYPVLFETVQALEQGIKKAKDRNSFLYPYPCHIILCHIDLDAMKFAIESLGRTGYFLKLLSEKATLSNEIAQGKSLPKITFANGSEVEIFKQNISGVEVVPVKVLIDKNIIYELNFFDLGMIKSAMGLDGPSSQKWMFFSSPNMVILKELTTLNIQDCVNQLCNDGAFKYYKPSILPRS